APHDLWHRHGPRAGRAHRGDLPAVRRSLRRSPAHAGRTCALRPPPTRRALPRNAIRRQGSDLEGARHGVPPRRLDSRLRFQGERLGEAGCNLFRARAGDRRPAGRRGRPRQPYGRGGPRDGGRRADEEGMSFVPNCLVFDIETVPDAELGRRLGFEGDDHAVAAAMLAAREEESGTSFLPLEQHRVVAISTLLRSGDQLQVWSLGEAASGEDDLIRRFFGGIEKIRPTLVSWNGSGLDLPVLHY